MNFVYIIAIFLVIFILFCSIKQSRICVGFHFSILFSITIIISSEFIFLLDNLLENHNFIHGLKYYGSFLGIKNNYTINAFDDIDYLNNSEFFNKNKGILFEIDEYEHLFQQEDNGKLKPITIGKDLSVKSHLSIKSFDNEQFEDIFDEKTIDLNDLKEMEMDLVDITNADLIESNDAKNVL